MVKGEKNSYSLHQEAVKFPASRNTLGKNPSEMRGSPDPAFGQELFEVHLAP